MKYTVLVLFALTPFTGLRAQNYKAEIAKWRKEYKEAFVNEERSPLKANDTASLRFFETDEKYKIATKFHATPDSQPFEMPTYSGKTKTFKQYGTAMFVLNDTVVTLCIYQNIKLLDDKKHKDHLFIPFTDGTSYTETYAGGRYIDLEIKDIIGDKLIIDFNKAYNPYCAYATGYNCPIPPIENRISIAVKAGEKLFGGKHKD